MKVYVDAWIYVTEKFVNMGNIELYEGVLRYEKADYPPIPNFICTHSPSNFLDFQGVSAFGVLAVTPFLHHFYTISAFGFIGFHQTTPFC